jgi:hypothetical protein
MPTREELYTALRNADKAGDTEGARKLANYIQSMPADAPAAPPAPQTSVLDSVKQGAINLASGAVRGAGSIGATLMWPIDKATDMIMGDRDPNVAGLITGKQPISRNEQRRRDLDSGLAYFVGAEPDSLLYKAGKLGGEVAGTAGIGGVVAGGVRAAAPVLARAGMSGPTLQTLANSIESGGMTLGSGAPSSRLADLAYRTAGGAISGGASAGMVNPSDAGAGAVVGGALPGVAKVGGAIGNKLEQIAQNRATGLMQSALKPTIKQLANGDADTAVRTLLDYGISPTRAGVEKMQGLIDDLNTQVADKIANSTATVPKQSVLQRLADVKTTFGNQVSPTADLAAIDRVGDDFLAHPLYPGPDLPVQAAQQLKQGTYQTLAKKYGQMGGAETEAQKGLARGLKEEIANAVPEVAGLNAEESKLITTLKVSERRALMEANKNPGGLSLLAKNPLTWAAFMADRSAAFKALAARMAYGPGAKAAGSVAPALESGLSNPLLRGAAVNSVSASER